MKKILLISTFLILGVNLFSFDWPIENTEAGNINANFGQKRGNTLSTSIVFKETTDDVKVIDSGRLLYYFDEENSDFYFPTTLGTSVIVTHNDELLSVYGNLNSESLDNHLYEYAVDYVGGKELGSTGNSGWQSVPGSLEFQIIDLKGNKAINPKLLMPRTENETPLNLANIKIENKNKEFFDLKVQKRFSAGIYKVYQEINTTSSPYKSSVTINGIETDYINYDTIGVENGKLYVLGKKKYTYNDLYSQEKLHLLGEATFTPGKLALGLSESDFLGKTKDATYNIVIY